MHVSDLAVGLVEYFIGTEYLYAMLLDPTGQIKRFRLASCAESFPDVDLLFDVLEHPYAWTPSQRTNVVRDFCENWGPRLLPPADALRPFDIVIIVPHHFLHGVPLHLVRCAEEPWATRHGVAYCSSGTLLARCVERNRARQFDARSWTFPLENDGAPPEGPPVRTCLGCGVDVLTGKDEAYRALAQAFSGQFPEAADVTERSDIKNALDMAHRIAAAEAVYVKPDAICLVCHGYHDAASADRSGLLLAGDAGVPPCATFASMATRRSASRTFPSLRSLSVWSQCNPDPRLPGFLMQRCWRRASCEFIARPTRSL